MGDGIEEPDRAAGPGSTRPALRAIAGVFARYANLTWGGGSATIAVLHEEVVVRRRWISEAQFNLSYALSRLTPGTNLLAFCTSVGWTTRRLPGALLALLGASLPAAVITALATHFFEVIRQSEIVQGALRGALAAAVAIMFYTALKLFLPPAKEAPSKGVVIAAGAILLSLQLALSPFQIVIVAAALGLSWPASEEKR
jgi:chromate transporter